jgi:hypothetical protein
MTASDTQPGLTRPRLIEDRIVASLRERGVPVEYVLAPDEDHGVENEENRLRSYRAVERHLAEHLGGRRGATSEGDAA